VGAGRGVGPATVGGGGSRGSGARPWAATSDRRRAGGRGQHGGARRGQHGGARRGHGVESGERNRKEEERSTTVVISNNSRRPGGAADGSYLIAVGCTRVDGR
jgi:hypothetical protein